MGYDINNLPLETLLPAIARAEDKLARLDRLFATVDLKNFNHFAWTGDVQDIVDSLRTGQVGSAFINDYFVRNAISCNGVFKETLRSAEITALRKCKLRLLAGHLNCNL